MVQQLLLLANYKINTQCNIKHTGLDKIVDFI